VLASPESGHVADYLIWVLIAVPGIYLVGSTIAVARRARKHPPK
jgi:hypothetical protein